MEHESHSHFSSLPFSSLVVLLALLRLLLPICLTFLFPLCSSAPALFLCPSSVLSSLLLLLFSPAIHSVNRDASNGETPPSTHPPYRDPPNNLYMSARCPLPLYVRRGVRRVWRRRLTSPLATHPYTVHGGREREAKGWRERVARGWREGGERVERGRRRARKG